MKLRAAEKKACEKGKWKHEKNSYRIYKDIDVCALERGRIVGDDTVNMVK